MLAIYSTSLLSNWWWNINHHQKEASSAPQKRHFKDPVILLNYSWPLNLACLSPAFHSSAGLRLSVVLCSWFGRRKEPMLGNFIKLYFNNLKKLYGWIIYCWYYHQYYSNSPEFFFIPTRGNLICQYWFKSEKQTKNLPNNQVSHTIYHIMPVPCTLHFLTTGIKYMT